MAIEIQTTETPLEPGLTGVLESLRGRIRNYVWTDGVALAVIVLGAAFWISFLLDWGFELPRPARIAILLGTVAAVIYVANRWLFNRLGVRLADRNMAVLLERRYRDFRDGLLTSVELSEAPEHAADFNREMLAHTRRDALAQAAQVDVEGVLNRQPLVQRIGIAVALVASVLLLAFAASEAFGVWVRRDVLLSNERWPRKTHLAIEGLDDTGHVKVARGSDWSLTVKADAATGSVVPDVVEVRYSTQDGARGRETMNQEGKVTLGDDPHQQYSHTFRSVLTTVEFYVVGGDDREGPYYLDAVDSPKISSMTLYCEYPEYMDQDDREIPGAQVMQLPRGTQITLMAEANKPLVGVHIEDISDENAPKITDLDITSDGEPADSFEFALPRLDTDQTLLFRLHDSDNIKSREPMRLVLRAVPDEAPAVNIQLRGIGTAMTAKAQLPAVGEIIDDFGLRKIWFEFHVDDQEAAQLPLSIEPDGEEKVQIAEAMEVRDLDLEPQQKFHWAVHASDTFALGSGPNVGAGQKYTIDVVSPEQMRAMLEARELMLRRKFEVTIEELKETRAYLSTIDSRSPAPPSASPLVPPPDPRLAPLNPQAGSPAKESTVPVLARGVQVERVLQNTQRASQETQYVAEEFDRIRDELINNRVDTEEVKRRLKDSIADPLKRIVAQQYTKLETDLQTLRTQVDSSQADRAPDNADAADPTAAAHAVALAQMDAVLAELDSVLRSMLQAETFNEILDILRQLIDSQGEVNDATLQMQRKQLEE